MLHVIANVTRSGRFLLALAITGFGVELLVYGQFVRGLPPVPPWTPVSPGVAYLVGAVLVAAGVGMLTEAATHLSAMVVGAVFIFSAVVLHGLHARAVLLAGDSRTGAFEALSLGAAALVLVAPTPREAASAASRRSRVVALVGRQLFAVSMIVFGAQHYLYTAFVATLVPPWLPGHIFWTYLTGTGFIAAGLAIAVNVKASLAATLLGVMFFLWWTRRPSSGPDGWR